ncbi:MAG TPA: CBS domain-containing protein [Acidimicrobiales bacterium]|nr:CBS domain-containing protein [Acidimicrobiales bacterium]
MSPRAAWRLEALGYAPVYDYVAGKADWLAAGLPTEGERPHPPRVGEIMNRAVATCTPDTPVDQIGARLDRDGGDVCVVVNEHGVVQGRLRRDRIDLADRRHADEVMEPGPTTVRADAPLAETLQRMKNRNVDSLIVSAPDGVLLGMVVNQHETEPPA